MLAILRILLLFTICFPLLTYAQSDGTPARVTSDGARVRAQANTKARIVMTLKKGTEVSILETSNDWCRIRAGASTGWLKASLLKIVESEDAASRSTPSIRDGNLIPGYTESSTLDADSLAAESSTMAAQPSLALEAEVLSGGAVLHAYPSAESKTLVTLEGSTVVIIRGRDNAWLQCEYDGRTGWIEQQQLSIRGMGMRTADAPQRSVRNEDALLATVQKISDEQLRDQAMIVLEDERRLRASMSALESRSERNENAEAEAAAARGEHFLRGLEADALRLNTACADLARLSDHASADNDRSALRSISEQGKTTVQRYHQSVERARSAPPSSVMLFGGQISVAAGSHTRSTIYDYSSTAPNLQSSAWLNTPTIGNFRARLDYSEDIVTTQFTRLNAGVDWRKPMNTQQWSARVNLFRYDDDIITNSYGLLDLHAGWEELKQSGAAFFARATYQGKTFTEAQPQEFTAFSVNTGLRSVASQGPVYEVNLLNRYQTSDDMGLNFNMINASGLWRGETGFSLRPSYEAYLTLADSGGSFLNYHRPGLEARWTRASGITDYGARFDYRYHPDAENLTFGLASIFAGHADPGLIGTNWNAMLLYQMNNGARNPSFVQSILDARHRASSFFFGFNGTTRWVLAEESDSLSQHFADLYVNPGVVFEIARVRLEAGPFVGTTLFLNNKTQALKDNLNNSVRTGLSMHALASFGARVNVRAWVEYEKAFHFIEDPYVGRKREPTRFRLGTEASVAIMGSLSVFGRFQSYSINNDTGIMINLPTGPRSRDTIDDTLLLLGLRYHM